MPLQVRSHTDRVITPWLWNLLPDNDLVLERWARRFQVSLSSPFALLSTPVGQDCPGAVRFALPSEIDRLLGKAGEVVWLSEEDVAQRLRDLEQDSTVWLGRNFTGQFSLAGAQAKTALFHREGRWGLPSGPIPTTHILKPAVAGFDDHDLNEHLCLEAARLAGLPAARSRVESFRNQTAVVIERYDRLIGEDGISRLHQEDLCQALGHPPGSKYQADGGPGPVEIVTLLRRVMPGRVASRAVQQFVDALIWNWLIAGTDAHAKNYSLLLAGGDVRLAPLYDVASFLPYPGHERDLRLAMKLGGDYRVYLHANHWPRVAQEFAVDADELIGRVRHLAAVAPAAFAEAAASPAVSALGRSLPGRLVDRVAERATRCAQLVG
jgi:serine/threonine-protein kinase HipA